MTETIKTQATKPHPISIDFFSRASSKTKELVNNKLPDFTVDGRHRWFDYSFVEPVYLTKISIESNGYKGYDKFEVEVDHIDGTKHQEKIPVSDGIVSLGLGKLASGFRFRPEQKWLSKTEILRVVAVGLTLEEFHAYEWSIKELGDRESKVARREQSAAQLEANIESLSKEKAAIATDIGVLEAQQNELKSTNSNLKEQSANLASRGEDLQAKIATREKALRDLDSRVETTRTDLDELTRELRLFPSEISGFVQEGNRNIKNYLLLSIPFVVVLVSVTWSLYSRAVDLTPIWRQEDGVDVWTVFLTRLPFVLVALALIEATGYILGRFVFEIVRINRQRLELSKLSIVAKDVSAASAHGTELTDEEVFEKETKLKMDLLREHMRGYEGSEFEYKGGAIISAIVGVANRYAGRKADN